MFCANCDETLGTGSIICQVCGLTQAGPAEGTGIATFHDRSHWHALPPAPESWAPGAGDMVDGFFGVIDVADLFFSLFDW